MNKIRSISRIAGAIVLGIILLVTQTLPVSAGPALFQLALELDGIDAYARAPDSSSLDLGTGATDDFTIEAFVYVPDLNNTTWDILTWKIDSFGLYIWCRTADSDRVVLRLYSSPGIYDYVYGDVSLSVGWHHVAAVWDNEWTADADKAALYVDGALIGSKTDWEYTPGVADSSHDVSIGADWGTYPTSGWMEEVRFSNTVRYSGSSYTVPTTAFADDAYTRALWHFDEAWGSGTTFADSSGNGNTLTAYGGAIVGNPTGSAPVTIKGSARVGGAVLHYTDGTPKTAVSAANGSYSFMVSYGWSGAVTPVKPNCNFTPTTKIYTNVTTDKTGQNYSVNCTFTYQSAGSQDGWVLESGENTNVGGSLNAAATTLLLGDNAARKQYRSILSFNTSGLPDAAVITQAKLKLTKQSVVGGGNPFTIFQGLRIDMRKGFFSTAASLQNADFQASASKPGLGAFNPTPSGSVYTISLPSTAYPYVNKLSTNAGLTQLRLRFTLDDNGNNAINTISFYSGNYSMSGSRPQLIITFHVP